MSHSYKKTVLVVGNIPPMREPSDIEIAWLAGLFEGEGTVHGANGKKTVASIPQKDPEILFRCRELLGGSISKTTREGTHLHIFIVCGDSGRKFLRTIYPFMSTRRKLQIEKAGGLILTGRVQWSSKITQERRAARIGMTEAQKSVESSAAYKARNRDDDRAYQREYRARNLEKIRAQYRERYAVRKLQKQQVQQVSVSEMIQ